jgi:hypothetical protein
MCEHIFQIFFRNIFRIFLYYHFMIVNDSNLCPKMSKNYCCNVCDYYTCKKSQYVKHLATDKHKKRENDSKMVVNDSNLCPKKSRFTCECGKIYKYDSGYYRHKKICTWSAPPTQSWTHPWRFDDIIHDKEIILMLMKQNTELMELLKNGVATNSHNTNSMNNNKTFNLQFFLNETCKDAMNIKDFVNSIQLQLSDLEKVGEIGYVQGITNIITSNLKALDITQRPVHCTDKKREIMYIKDEDKWEKEDENNTKLRNAIKTISNKNIRLLHEFREKHPECNDAESTISDKYCKMVIEAMGGAGNNNMEKEDKIIHNISKCITIYKENL